MILNCLACIGHISNINILDDFIFGLIFGYYYYGVANFPCIFASLGFTVLQC